MNDPTHPRHDPPAAEEILAAARAAFACGEVSRCWALIAPLLARIGRQPENLRDDLRYLQLGCALYREGDLNAARDLNARLPTTLWRPMRYRLSLRLRDPLTAARLRRDRGVTDREGDDFRTSAGLHALWARRYRSGFPLYARRVGAINFPKVLPDSVTHAPLPADPADDVPLIVLEQGLGDVLFHLAHIRAEGRHEASAFTGLPKYAPLIRRYLPQARFLPREQIEGRPAAHLSADFVARGFARSGDLNPRMLLDAPARGPLDRPVFGLCWRGGSGQNRREERHIPLPWMLDLMPRDAILLALQFDLTEKERAILHADPRCRIPLADITANPVATIDMIRRLAGVISVDSANWHMAGFSGVPLLAIMNRTPHWFWGPRADAASIFPSATTMPKETLDPEGIAGWISEAREGWKRRPAAPFPTRASGAVATRPVFVTGLPRSGTSMVMRALAANGLWVGETVAGNADNPEGYFENRALRDGLVKDLLAGMGADRFGVSPLPPREALPPCPGLARRALRMITEEGYDGASRWGFKDPKLTLLWPLFAEAFPEATWIFVRRDRDAVLQSIAQASFMRRHSPGREFWTPFCLTYEARLRALQASGARVLEIDADAIMRDGELSGIEAACRAAGLSFDADITRRALMRSS